MEPAYVCIVFNLDDAGVFQEKLVPSELNRLRAPKSEKLKEDRSVSPRDWEVGRGIDYELTFKGDVRYLS